LRTSTKNAEEAKTLSEKSIAGSWENLNLKEGADPGAPDESLIEISAKEIRFPNGGGGFANGPYQLDKSGVY
jgi:hypothetical protein